MSTENLYQNRNDEYGTPKWLKDGLFANWFDPCPLSEGLVDRDGLGSVWSTDRIFLNPPYSNPLPWVERAIQEHRKGKTLVLLLKHDSSTVWWAKLHEAGAHFLAVIGRLQFTETYGQRIGRKAAAPFPSVLAILYGDPNHE